MERETRPGLGLCGLKVWVCVLGCRSNIYDGEAISGELAARGAQIADSPKGCRVVVIVSCSVTAAADKKCRQAVRRARREMGKDGVVAVCGCWAQALDAKEARALGVNLLVGNRRKSALPDALESALEAPEFIDMRGNGSPGDRWDALRLDRPILRTRAFLKVQEGCDHFCSYCVIPFLRGRSISRPLEETLEEARRVTASGCGCGEIVLTGIHLGMYGRDSRPGEGSSLAELVRRVSRVPGLKRLRLGSLEPFALDGDLLEALGDSPVFCPHLHLPLQSGDDEVLALMRRGYGADDFARLCERAREKLGGDLHISSDVLVGFPGESEGAFQNTLALMRRAGLGRVHVFPYSPRPGTAAAAFPNRVPPRVVSERVSAALALGEELLARYASRFVGRDLSVLVEGTEEARTARATLGYTRHFVSVALEKVEKAEENAAPARPGREIEVRITDCVGGELKGRLEKYKMKGGTLSIENMPKPL